MSKYRVVHYINQFYAGIGGEEQANIKPQTLIGPIGPGTALNIAFDGQAEIVGTVICGDSYFNENLESAQKVILEMIQALKPDILIAGPGFNAGRYGIACGAVCKVVTENLNIPAVTGLYKENPGTDMYKVDAYIIQTGNSAAQMRKAIPLIAKLALKLLNKMEVQPETDGYFVRGRINYFAQRRGSYRAVDMLVKKLNNEAFLTEYPMPEFDNVEPGKAIPNIANAKIALVTSGGICPKGNPDRIESSSASKYGKYNLDGVNNLTFDTYETAHGGYDPTYANHDADRVLPVDVIRDLVAENLVGSLHQYFYSTTGNGTAVASSKKFASQIARDLVADGVDAVILTST